MNNITCYNVILQDVTSELNKAIENPLSIDNISIIPEDLKTALTDFSHSGIVTINYATFDEQVYSNISV